jgi:PAS domain S-box-containing protein
VTDAAAAGAFTEADLYRAIVDVLPDVSVFAFDSELRYVHVAGAGVSRIGWDPDELLGKTPRDVLPGEEGVILEEHFRAALEGEVRKHEHPGIRRSDAWWETTITPLHDAAGVVVGGLAVSRDIAETRRSEQARRRLERTAEASSRNAEEERSHRERLEFLNEINNVIAGAEDRREVMQAVARAVVPRLGDWCSIYVFFDPRDQSPEIEVAHVDPEMVAEARSLLRRFPYDSEAPTGVPHVIRTGEVEFHPDIDDAVLDEMQAPSEVVEVVHRLALRSSITVPLVKRRRALGAMQFVLSGPGRQYGQDDVTLALALAGRVASAIDNRRLAERQREIARTLQRSLLPARLPAIPGVDVAVRYWAAGEGTEVGGDFYDVFGLGEGRFAVVVGDVCGNGPEAAALTGLARHNVRANAWRGDSPAEVLRHLNEAIYRTNVDTFCTLVYAELAHAEDGVHVTIASGGHPPPVLVPAEGPARYAELPPGLLVGAFAGTSFRETTLRLEPGDTVIFCTDGATDLPPPDTLTDAELVEMATDAARSTNTAEEAVARLSESLDRRTPFNRRHDDVAILVLRAVAPG